jgi:hypothetical protein
MAVIVSEKCERCHEEFVVLIGNGNDGVPARDLPCKWACPECGHEHFVTWQRPPAVAMGQADLRIVPDDFNELGLVIAELCTSEDMPTA